jgi:hypothetical protein
MLSPVSKNRKSGIQLMKVIWDSTERPCFLNSTPAKRSSPASYMTKTWLNSVRRNWTWGRIQVFCVALSA